jgi:NAD(P)H-quinone oxidoreductase subunit 4
VALSFLIWCPIVSGLLLFLFPGASSSRTCQNFSLGSALFTLIWSVGLLTQIDLHHSGWQLQEYVPWVQSIGLNYALAIDVISLPLVWLNCLLVMIAIFASRGGLSAPDSISAYCYY